MNGDISEKQILYIISEVAKGINHMHSQNPPISHRDIKIENILMFVNNYKLCDFGSATTTTIDPKKDPKNTVLDEFSRFEKTTTPMYRPPEMLDMYSKFPVNSQVDVWMLGCILYTLTFKKHPFMNVEKLTIINAFYYIPEQHNYSEKLVDFIRLLLTPNPVERPNIKTVISYIQKWDQIEKITLSKEVQEIKNKQTNSNEVNSKSNPKLNLISDDEIKRIQAEILKKQNKGGKRIKKSNLIL